MVYVNPLDLAPGHLVAGCVAVDALGLEQPCWSCQSVAHQWVVGLCKQKERIRVVALETCGHEWSCLEHRSACIPVALVKFTLK